MNSSESGPVAIVGGGPVGLSVALGLARRGVPSSVFEMNRHLSRRSKAAGVHVRTREILRQWGVLRCSPEPERMLEVVPMHDVRSGRARFRADLRELTHEAHEPGLLMMEQSETERHLFEALQATGLSNVHFGSEIVGLVQDAGGVELSVRDAHGERKVRAEYVVGADGASSFVRNALGMPFEGVTLPMRPTLADVRIEDERDGSPWPRMRNDAAGLSAALRLRQGLWRVIRLEPGDPPEPGQAPNGVEEAAARHAQEVLGPGPVEVQWASRFRFHRRSTPRMREGRVVLAGDAAHVHPPAGGQGMNAGIQDAHNLAWKLDACLRGGNEDALLGSYDSERRAVIGSVSAYTTRITRIFLQSPAPLRAAAFSMLSVPLWFRRSRLRFLRRLSMLDLDYPASSLLGDARGAVAGRRLPNVRLRAPDGRALRLYDTLTYGPTLIDLRPRAQDASGLPLPAVVRIGDGGYREEGDVLERFMGGEHGLVLVRPDLHVAGVYTEEGLGPAIATGLGGLAA